MFNRSRMISALLAGLTLALLTSCTKNDEESNNPKARLKDYIEKSFRVKKASDKKELEDFLTGEARDRLKAWSTEQFSVAFIDKKRSSPKFKLKDMKELSPDEVNITYELSYTNEGDAESFVINRKSCQMVREDSVWYISKCRNLKQVVEYRDAIEVLPTDG